MNRSLFIVLSIILLSFANSVEAAEFSVNDAASLIAAINTANGNGEADVITLAADIVLPGVHTNNVFFGDIGLPLITSNITINGNGFAIERDSSMPLFRVISINGGTLTINDATIRNGSATGGFLSGGGNILVANNGRLNLFNSVVETGVSTLGGGILNFSGTINVVDSLIQTNATYLANENGAGINNAGVATITNSHIFGNVAFSASGAGIYNTGTMTVTNSTLSENISIQHGAGIYNTGTLTLNNVTIIANTSFNFSSGIYNTGTATVNNSIISGNQLGECILPSGTFTAPANNIFGRNGMSGGCTGGTVLAGEIETLLEPLADNGGPTRTYALAAGSPAINASSGGTSSDQRGAAAVGIRDIGAFESSGTVPTVTVGVVSATSVLENGGFVTIPVTVANLAAGNSLTVVANISGGTATQNTDYTITSSLSFNANGSQDFVITALPDALTEGNETLIVSFSLIGAAEISGNGNQTVTILDLVAPQFTKSFSPGTIFAGTSTLTFTIDNTANPADATALDFTDNLPAGMTIATPANESTTCTGGTITAASGTGIITYTGGAVSNGASCTLQVDIEGVLSGTHINTTGDLTSSLGNSGPASDSLTVNIAPGFSKAFAASPIILGDITSLIFTIDNSASVSDATNLDFTDNLPAGMTIATPANESTTCTGGAITALSGTGLITYTGGTVSASASCTLQVDVEGILLGTHTNITGDLTSDLGNSGSATADLIVNSSPSDPATPTSPTRNTSSAEPSIGVFDPAISKLGLLVPGQVGVTGEQLEWIVTVSNTGAVVGNNVVVSDTLNPGLRIDSVDAPNASVAINGQTVTVTYAALQLGESQQFSIFTTVLDGASVDNTACVTAANQGAEECVTALPIRQLPNTGETPLWAYSTVFGLGALGLSMLFVLLKSKKA